jgi:hypothetical protein
MNERIRELADEAAKFSAVMALSTGESGDELFVERFAELIVRECMNVADASQFSNEGYPVGLAIQEHFGVEE